MKRYMKWNRYKDFDKLRDIYYCLSTYVSVCDLRLKDAWYVGSGRTQYKKLIWWIQFY